MQRIKEELLQLARQFQLEGLIAKRPDSLYEAGRRSGAWVKIKLTRAQEFVIGGYTTPEGSRKYFGALLVGYYGSDGLLFAGRVGTGFSERALANVYEGMQKIKCTNCPFINLPERRPGRWGLGITPAVMKDCQWVEPVLVAQVKFTEWTSDDQLRQPPSWDYDLTNGQRTSFANRHRSSLDQQASFPHSITNRREATPDF